ncbi:MAG: hypothetical protein ABJQ14_16140 [Hyphomicrobiales bacterium]
MGFYAVHPASAKNATREGNSSEAEALSRLGELLLDGQVVGFDPYQAQAFFSKAALLGNRTARLRLAELTIRGIGTKREVKGALSEIKLIANEGSLSALVSLGDVYSRGYVGTIDLKAAISAYDKAAEAGSIAAALRLSEIYRYGLLGKTESRRAYEYLNRAKALGDTYALYLMGTGMIEGDFRKFGRPKKGLALFREAEKLGVNDAKIALAMRRNNRSAQLLPHKKIVRNLSKLADAGNVQAALRLFDYYLNPQNGKSRRLTTRNIKKARVLLQRVAEQLEPNELDYRVLLLDIIRARRAKYPALYARINAIPPASRPSLMRRTLRSSPNAYVFFVQMQLSEKGFFRGKRDGLLKRRTIRAIKAYCTHLGAGSLCRRGPLSAQTTNLLTHLF